MQRLSNSGRKDAKSPFFRVSFSKKAGPKWAGDQNFFPPACQGREKKEKEKSNIISAAKVLRNLRRLTNEIFPCDLAKEAAKVFFFGEIIKTSFETVDD